MSDKDKANSDNESQSNDKPVKKSKWLSKRIWLLSSFTLLIIVVIALYAIYYFLVGQFYISTDDAYVKGNKIAVMPRVTGTAVNIPVMATKFINKGDLLVKLDDTDARLKFNQAKSNLAQTVRQVQALFATADQQKSQIKVNQAKLKLIEKNYKRYKYMLKQGAITQEQFDKKTMQLDVAKANLSVTNGSLKVTEAKISGTTIANNPQVKLASATVHQDYLDLKRTRILAPVTGYISQRTVKIGQRVNPGKSLMTIVPLNQIWVDANFKETKLSSVRMGQPVKLTSDMYGSSVTFHGRIIGLYGGTGSSFELLPPQNATGNWIKIVQRIPVRVGLDAKEIKKHPLYLGISMSATVDISDTSGARLAGKAKPGSGYSTDIYKKRSNKADALIKKIINSNIHYASADLSASDTKTEPNSKK